MNQTERFYKIDQMISDARLVTFQQMLEALEISRATLRRDLEYMRNRLNAPIVFDRLAGGYCFDSTQPQIGGQYELPGLWFSSAEIHALLTMQHLLANLDPGGIQTEIERTVKVRLAQSFFRRVVLSAFQAHCCVTGNPIAELLVASHILPWASHPEQRVNPRNGLCLSRLHDGAFDQGLIAFDDDYRMILSKCLKDHSTNQNIRDNFAGYEGKPLKMPERFYPDKTFLAGHRESVFQSQ
jgi:predicted restriction endonuclease